MKVARLHGARDVRIHDEPRPAAAAGELLVRVEAVGLCGSDLHWFEDGGIGGTTIARPLVPGHEFAGRHARTAGSWRSTRRSPAGTACSASRAIRTSARRSASPATARTTGRCASGWPGRPSALPAARGLHGSRRRDARAPRRRAAHAATSAHVRPGASVGVFGCGPIGLFALQVAKLAGAGAARRDRPPVARPSARGGPCARAPRSFAADDGREARAIVDAAGRARARRGDRGGRHRRGRRRRDRGRATRRARRARRDPGGRAHEFPAPRPRAARASRSRSCGA